MRSTPKSLSALNKALVPRLRWKDQTVGTLQGGANLVVYGGPSVQAALQIGQQAQLFAFLAAVRASALRDGTTNANIITVGQGVNPNFKVSGSRTIQFISCSDAIIHLKFYWCKPKYQSLNFLGFRDSDVEAATIVGTTDQAGAAAAFFGGQINKEPVDLEAFNDRWRVVKTRSLNLHPGKTTTCKLSFGRNHFVNGETAANNANTYLPQHTTQLLIKAYGQLSSDVVSAGAATGTANWRLRFVSMDHFMLQRIDSNVNPYLVQAALQDALNAPLNFIGNNTVEPEPVNLS